MRVAVTGAGGMVGREVVEVLAPHEVTALDHDALDVADRGAVLGAIGSLRPDAIVHCAAWTAVDACESDPDRAFRVNALGTRFVMDCARRTGAYVVFLSTDYVFDGTKAEPYHEWDTPHPCSVYGASKRAGELEIDASCAVVRDERRLSVGGTAAAPAARSTSRANSNQLTAPWLVTCQTPGSRSTTNERNSPARSAATVGQPRWSSTTDTSSRPQLRQGIE